MLKKKEILQEAVLKYLKKSSQTLMTTDVNTRRLCRNGIKLRVVVGSGAIIHQNYDCSFLFFDFKVCIRSWIHHYAEWYEWYSMLTGPRLLGERRKLKRAREKVIDDRFDSVRVQKFSLKSTAAHRVWPFQKTADVFCIMACIRMWNKIFLIGDTFCIMALYLNMRIKYDGEGSWIMVYLGYLIIVACLPNMLNRWN